MIESPTDLAQAQQPSLQTSDTVVAGRATDPRRQPASAPPKQENDLDEIVNAGASAPIQYQQQAPSSRDETPNRLNPNKHEDG